VKLSSVDEKGTDVTDCNLTFNTTSGEGESSEVRFCHVGRTVVPPSEKEKDLWKLFYCRGSPRWHLPLPHWFGSQPWKRDRKIATASVVARSLISTSVPGFVGCHISRIARKFVVEVAPHGDWKIFANCRLMNKSSVIISITNARSTAHFNGSTVCFWKYDSLGLFVWGRVIFFRPNGTPNYYFSQFSSALFGSRVVDKENALNDSRH